MGVTNLVINLVSLISGAVIGIWLKKFEEKIAWSDTRIAICDLIADDLFAIGNSGVDTFLQLIQESPKVSEFTRNLQKYQLHIGSIGEYRYSGSALKCAIWYPAWMQFEVSHGDYLFSLSLSAYTKLFYENAFKNIDRIRSNISLLIIIPGDMKVKMACVKFERAATGLSWAIDECTKQGTCPSIQIALHFLYAALELNEALNETTIKPRITDRLNTWWLTGK